MRTLKLFFFTLLTLVLTKVSTAEDTEKSSHPEGYEFLAIAEFLMDAIDEPKLGGQFDADTIGKVKEVVFTRVFLSDAAPAEEGQRSPVVSIEPDAEGEGYQVTVFRPMWTQVTAQGRRFGFVFQCLLNAVDKNLSARPAFPYLIELESRVEGLAQRMKAAKTEVRLKTPVKAGAEGFEELLAEATLRAQLTARWERVFLLLRDPQPEIRASALRVLSDALKEKSHPYFPKERALVFFSQTLADSDLGVRREARRCLAALEEEAVPTLVNLVQYGPANVAEIAADVLGDLGVKGAGSVKALRWLNVRFVGTAENWSRAAAAAADNLRRIGTPEALTTVQWLEHDVRSSFGPQFEQTRQTAEASAIKVPGLAKEKVPEKPMESLSTRLWAWESGTDSLLWTNPNFFVDPRRHYERQLHAHALLVALTRKVPILPVPLPDDYKRARREVIGVLNALAEPPWPSVLVWNEASGGAYWTDPNTTADPGLHYQRQSYLFSILAGSEGTRLLPIVSPTVFPKTKKGFQKTLQQQRREENEPTKKKRHSDIFSAGLVRQPGA